MLESKQMMMKLRESSESFTTKKSGLSFPKEISDQPFLALTHFLTIQRRIASMGLLQESSIVKMIFSIYSRLVNQYNL